MSPTAKFFIGIFAASVAGAVLFPVHSAPTRNVAADNAQFTASAETCKQAVIRRHGVAYRPANTDQENRLALEFLDCVSAN